MFCAPRLRIDAQQLRQAHLLLKGVATDVNLGSKEKWSKQDSTFFLFFKNIVVV